MQKVEGSSPFIRSRKAPGNRGFFLARVKSGILGFTPLVRFESGSPAGTFGPARCLPASTSSGAPHPPHLSAGAQAVDGDDPLVTGSGYVRHPQAGQSGHRIRGGGRGTHRTLLFGRGSGFGTIAPSTRTNRGTSPTRLVVWSPA
jgi:hypothetical protein